MKLAQALMERADVQRRLAQLNQRLQQNAQFQEGETPAEDPAELLAEYRRASKTLAQLVVAIHRANHAARLADGTPMVAALAERERLQGEHAMLVRLADAATPDQSRYSRSEIRMLPAVAVKEIRREADLAAKRCRELDVQIQEANWLFRMDDV